MAEITFINKTGKKVISSSDVQQYLKNITDIVTISDISDSLKEKNVMIFDCKLDNLIFKFEPLYEEFYEEFAIGEDYYQVIYEDVSEYLKELVSGMQQDLREVYEFEKIKLTHNIYDFNEDFTDIKFVMAVSFKDISGHELADLTRITAKRQLLGSSKYFN